MMFEYFSQHFLYLNWNINNDCKAKFRIIMALYKYFSFFILFLGFLEYVPLHPSQQIDNLISL